MKENSINTSSDDKIELKKISADDFKLMLKNKEKYFENIDFDAKRSSATSRKCRCSKAKVLEIVDLISGNPIPEIESNYDNTFIYKVGETVEVKDFDEDRWKECAPGIHFFITRREAECYFG